MEDLYSEDKWWRCSALAGNIPYAKKSGPFTYILHQKCGGIWCDGFSGKCKSCGEMSPAYLRMICLVKFNMI